MQQLNEPVTVSIIIATGVLTFLGFKNPKLFNRLMFDNRMILQSKEYFRLISSGFLHTDWMHFAFNMFSLFSFGKYIEKYYTATDLLLIYFASVVGGNVLSLILYRNSEYKAIGASGGVCGVIYASVFLIPGGSIMILPVPVPIPSWVYAILFLLISFYGMRSARGNIGHVAHIGGALVGLFVTFLLFPQAVLALPELVALIILISGAILAWEFYKTKTPTKRY
jgi:membrane associated rhomboid family serine protease